MGKRHRYFSKEDIKTADRHVKKNAQHYQSTGKQTKTSTFYHCISHRMNKSEIIQRDENVELYLCLNFA